MSPTLLSQRLTRLERTGLVERVRGIKGRREYQMTEPGQELRPVVEVLDVWGSGGRVAR